MTKKEFAKLLFEKLGIDILSSRILDNQTVYLDEKQVELLFEKDGENLSIINFGKLEVVERAPRLGRNPKTGEEVKIGKRKSVKFRPGKAFLEKLN